MSSTCTCITGLSNHQDISFFTAFKKFEETLAMIKAHALPLQATYNKK